MDPATPIVLVLAALLAGVDAPAAKEAAREHARQGGVSYNLGHYEEAAKLYEASYRLVQDPTLLFNIGQSWRLAGRPDRALAAYKGFLRTASADDPNRTAVETRAAEMEKAIRTAAPAPSSAGGEKPAPAAPTQRADSAPASGPFSPVPPRQGAGLGRATGEPAPVRSPGAFFTSAPRGFANPDDARASAPRSGTTVGAHFGAAGRDGESVNVYRGFGRLIGGNERVYELGYFRQPLYPMAPAFRYSALYGSVTATNGWAFELGALGRDAGWHMAATREGRYLDAGLRLEGLSPDALCGSGNARVLYAIPEARLRVPVTPRFTVRAETSYRGKLSSRNCGFRPSLLAVDLSGRWALSERWLLDGGIGHYGLHDFGDGGTPAGWPGRGNAAELVHLGARYVLGRMAFFADLRSIAYEGAGTFALLLGAEFHSGPPAP